MKKTFYTSAVKAILFILCFGYSVSSSSQAKSSLGIAGTLNYPSASKYKLGYGGALQGNIRLSEKVALSPSIELNKIKAEFTGHNVPKHSVDLYAFRLAAKYYFSEHVFADGGALAYLADEDGLRRGITATVSAGYRFNIDGSTFLETSIWTHFIELYGHEVTPILGLKAAIQFGFRK